MMMKMTMTTNMGDDGDIGDDYDDDSDVSTTINSSRRRRKDLSMDPQGSEGEP